MNTYKICKYDYNDPDYVNDWMYIDEFFARKNNQLTTENWKEYLSTELSFLDFVNHLFCEFNGEEFFLIEYKNFIDDEDNCEGCFENLVLSKNMIPDYSIVKFSQLTGIEKFLLFQLAVRGLCTFKLKTRSKAVSISTMDDCFYFYIEIKKDKLEQITCDAKNLFIYDWRI